MPLESAVSAARTGGGGPRAGGINRAMMLGLGVEPMSPSRMIVRYWSGISIRARSANSASALALGMPAASRMSCAATKTFVSSSFTKCLPTEGHSRQ